MPTCHSFFTAGILENSQGISSATWRLRRETEQEGKRVQKRDIMYLALGVGGNAKTGITYYGKGQAILEVCFDEKVAFLFPSFVGGGAYLVKV